MPGVHRRCLTIQKASRDSRSRLCHDVAELTIERFGDVGSKDQEQQTSRLLVRVPEMSRSLAQTSVEARSAALPPESVDNSTSLSIRSGYFTASACAINPPIDQPITPRRSMPRISITRAASAASFAMSNDRPSSLEPPIPRLFSRISSLQDASPSMKHGCQWNSSHRNRLRPKAVGPSRFADTQFERRQSQPLLMARLPFGWIRSCPRITSK